MRNSKPRVDMKRAKAELDDILKALDEIPLDNVTERKALLEKEEYFFYDFTDNGGTPQTNSAKGPALHMAIVEGNIKAIEKILSVFVEDAPIQIKKTSSLNVNALLLAVKFASVKVLEVLLKFSNREVFNVQNKFLESPLLIAIELDSLDKVSLLLEKGALEAMHADVMSVLRNAFRSCTKEMSHAPTFKNRKAIFGAVLKELMQHPELLPESFLPSGEASVFIYDLDEIDLSLENDFPQEKIISIINNLANLQFRGYVLNIESTVRQLFLQIIKYQIKNLKSDINYPSLWNILGSFSEEVGLLKDAVSYYNKKEPGAAVSLLKKCSLPEAELLFGYIIEKGMGMVPDDNNAIDHYVAAFSKAQEECKKPKANKVFLIDIQNTIIEKFIQLMKNPSNRIVKERIIFSLINCYVVRGEYNEALKYIEQCDVALLDDEMQRKFQINAGTTYYLLASKQVDMGKKNDFLIKAEKQGNGSASLLLAEQAYNEVPANFVKAAEHCIAALSATHSENTEKALRLLTDYFKTLIVPKYDQPISSLIFKAVWTIFNLAKASDKNWDLYKPFLKTLLSNNNLNEQDRMDVHSVALMCIKNGRTFDQKNDVDIIKVEYGILANKEAKKAQAITQKFGNFTGKHHFLSLYFYAVCEEDYGVKIENNIKEFNQNYYEQCILFGGIALADTDSADEYKSVELKKIQTEAAQKVREKFLQSSKKIKNSDVHKDNISYVNQIFDILINKDVAEVLKQLNTINKKVNACVKQMEALESEPFFFWRQRIQKVRAASTQQNKSDPAVVVTSASATPSAPPMDPDESLNYPELSGYQPLYPQLPAFTFQPPELVSEESSSATSPAINPKNSDKQDEGESVPVTSQLEVALKPEPVVEENLSPETPPNQLNEPTSQSRIDAAPEVPEEESKQPEPVSEESSSADLHATNSKVPGNQDEIESAPATSNVEVAVEPKSVAVENPLSDTQAIPLNEPDSESMLDAAPPAPTHEPTTSRQPERVAIAVSSSSNVEATKKETTKGLTMKTEPKNTPNKAENLSEVEADDEINLDEEEESATQVMLEAQNLMLQAQAKIRQAQELKRKKLLQSQKEIQNLEQLKTENEKLKQDLAALKLENNSLSDENKSLREQVSQLKEKELSHKREKFDLKYPKKFFNEAKGTPKAEVKKDVSGKQHKLVRSDSEPNLSRLSQKK